MWMGRYLRRMASAGRALALIGLCLALPPPPAAAVSPVAAAGPSAITVAIDDNYPPYVFRDERGELRGILPELWDLWSRRTGISVRLMGLDWSEAQRRFNAGEADVLDTVFRTEARERVYDFTPPYATLEVPIFFGADLSGIADARSLAGFSVGVKDGDACIDTLRSQGIDSVRRYGSYEMLIDAAARNEVRVFCIDKPPAVYLLVKKGLEDRFRASPPLYSGQFHRAVLKERHDLLRVIEDGFARITPAETQAVEDRWLGQSLARFDTDRILRRAGLVLLVFGGAALALVGWVWALRRQVAAKTGALRSALDGLAVSERRFRTMFDSINDAIFIHDATSGVIVQVNRRMREMYGYDAGDDLGRLSIGDLSEGVPPFGQDDALEWVRKAGREPQVFEWHARRKDGSLFWVEVSMRRAVIDAAGESLLVAVRDISERREAAERLTRTIDALTRSNTDLERFAYVASHDLREPLNTVVRYTQLLQSRYGERFDADADDFIGFIVSGAKQMLRLVDGLLEFSRIEARGRRFDVIDSGRALRVAMDNLGHAISESGAIIEAQLLPKVAADEVQLIQLFQNLLSNALKYRALDRQPRLSVSCAREGGQWRFSIADNGIGIDPAYRDQIFVIFKRLHTQQSIPGIGIGLALCKRIVERHGGRIWAEAAPAGPGTVFHFTLGIETAEPDAIEG